MSDEFAKILVNILPSIISGFSGLIGVLVGSWLSHKREKEQLNQQKKINISNKKVEYYIQLNQLIINNNAIISSPDVEKIVNLETSQIENYKAKINNISDALNHLKGKTFIVDNDLDLSCNEIKTIDNELNIIKDEFDNIFLTDDELVSLEDKAKKANNKCIEFFNEQYAGFSLFASKEVQILFLKYLKAFSLFCKKYADLKYKEDVYATSVQLLSLMKSELENY